jgi:hypothetical protein
MLLCKYIRIKRRKYSDLIQIGKLVHTSGCAVRGSNLRPFGQYTNTRTTAPNRLSLTTISRSIFCLSGDMYLYTNRYIKTLYLSNIFKCKSAHT